MFRRILIATDGSELSERAIRGGAALAVTLNADATLVHVLGPVIMPFSQGAAVEQTVDISDRVLTAARKDGEECLRRGADTARAAGAEVESVLADASHPWRGILDTASARNCDLIVMAAHGRGGLSALLLGSEANKVVTHSPVPVLVYR